MDYKEKDMSILWSAPTEKAQEDVAKMMTGPHFLAFAQSLASKLEKSKWICGDKLTIYDLVIGCFLVDEVTNKKNGMVKMWSRSWLNCPERLKKYVEDF